MEIENREFTTRIPEFKLPVKTNKLESAFDDKTIKIWDIESGLCSRTIKGHTRVLAHCNFWETTSLRVDHGTI